MGKKSEPGQRDFVSSFEEEEYEVSKFLRMSGGPDDDDDDDDDDDEETIEDIPELPENDKDIFDDDEGESYIRDYF